MRTLRPSPLQLTGPEFQRRGNIDEMVNVIVVVGLLVLVAAVLLPSFKHVGGSARHMQCNNNLKQLGVALTNYHTTFGCLPALTMPAPGLAGKDSQVKTRLIGWYVSILPWMDNAGAIEYITTQPSESEAITAVGKVQSQSFTVLQCPDDQTHFKQSGGLSYALNMGYGNYSYSKSGSLTYTPSFGVRDHSARSYDWNRSGGKSADEDDIKLARATGVFFPYDDEDHYHATLDAISGADGTGQTIMATESLNIPLMTAQGTGGISPTAQQLGVGIGLSAIGVPTPAGNLHLDQSQPASSDFTKHYRINSNRGTAVGGWIAPSSGHSGVVSVLFCDGHVGGLSEDMHWAIYSSLFTPEGVRHGQDAIGDGEF